MALSERLVRQILWAGGTALVTSACPAAAAFLALTLGEGHDKVQVIAFLVGVPLAFVASAYVMIRKSRETTGLCPLPWRAPECPLP